MIKIDIVGLKDILKNVENLEKNLENIDLTDEGKQFEDDYMRRIFKRGEKTNGNRIVYKNGGYTNKKGKILYDTGFLFNNINVVLPKNQFAIIINDDNNKLKSLEKRFGEIFKPQTSEIQLLKQLIRNKVIKSL